MSDLKDELEQERREKEWAETWKPQAPGDMLVGTLEGYDQATTDFGTYRVAHIRDEEGVLRALWLMHNVLQDEWEEAAPEVGERVGVQYHGKRSGENYDYHMWAVKVDRSENAPQAPAGEDTPQASAKEGTAATESENAATAGGDRAPKESGPDFPGDELFGEPAAESETDGGESTLEDPNGGLPY